MEAISLFVQPKPLLSETIERIVADGTLKARALVLSPGDYLFREGDDMRETFYLTRGLVRLYSGTPDGYAKTVFFHKAGTLIGFQGFRPEVDRKPSILNAKATTKVEAFAIDAERFGSYLKTHGDVCYAMAQYLFEMMSLQTREAVNASVYPVLQRFSALLLTLAREELAEMLGVHVNSITNSVVALRNADCAERQRGALVITDFKKLKSIAENLIVEN